MPPQPSWQASTFTPPSSISVSSESQAGHFMKQPIAVSAGDANLLWPAKDCCRTSPASFRMAAHLFMNLDEKQRQQVAAWIAEGLKLSEIQNRIANDLRSEEHTSELQSPYETSY